MSTSTSTSFTKPFNFGSSTMRAGAGRRLVLLALLVGCVLTLFYLGSIRHSAGAASHGGVLSVPKTVPGQHTRVEADLKGHVIAQKLGNETAKYAIRPSHLYHTSILIPVSQQSRARQRSLETPPHHLRPLPGQAHSRRTRSPAPIHPPLPAPLPLR
jgi:hypothetical protein